MTEIFGFRTMPGTRSNPAIAMGRSFPNLARRAASKPLILAAVASQKTCASWLTATFWPQSPDPPPASSASPRAASSKKSLPSRTIQREIACAWPSISVRTGAATICSTPLGTLFACLPLSADIGRRQGGSREVLESGGAFLLEKFGANSPPPSPAYTGYNGHSRFFHDWRSAADLPGGSWRLRREIDEERPRTDHARSDGPARQRAGLRVCERLRPKGLSQTRRAFAD